MKSDIEIARSIELKKIKQVAESVDIPRDEVENYGRYIAKIPTHLIDEEKVKKSNLILVTAITATKAGIGKTTVSIGLALGLNKIGKKAIVALTGGSKQTAQDDLKAVFSGNFNQKLEFGGSINYILPFKIS